MHNDTLATLGGLLFDPDAERRKLDEKLLAAEAKGIPFSAQVRIIQRHYAVCVLLMAARGFLLCTALFGLAGLISQQWLVFCFFLGVTAAVHIIAAVVGVVWIMRPPKLD